MSKPPAKRELTRRSLLKLGLAGAAALPFLKYASRSSAASSVAPQRLILFPSMNGADRAYFWPNPGNLPAMSTITEPLKRYQSQMTFIDGLNIEGSYNHFAVRSMFTGFPINDYLTPDPTVKSVDQVVADHLAAFALAARPEPYECAAEYMASFAYGLDHHDTPCLVTSLADDFRAGKLGIVDFYVKLTATKYFTSRVDP